MEATVLIGRWYVNLSVMCLQVRARTEGGYGENTTYTVNATKTTTGGNKFISTV